MSRFKFRVGKSGRQGKTNLLALGAGEDTLPVLVVNRLGDAHRLADDADAAQDAAALGVEGED
jgi:hypothetical protein